jgi:hypothetical protein
VERERDSSFERLLLRDLEMGKKHIKVDQKRRIKAPFESFNSQNFLFLFFFLASGFETEQVVCGGLP